MAGQTVQIAILADAGKAVSGFQGAGTAATNASKEFEKAGRAAVDMGEKFDSMGSMSSQISGGIGDIGGALTTYADSAKAAAAASDLATAKQLAVSDAAIAYNKAVSEFGMESNEAKKAQLALNQAQRDAEPPTAIEEWGAKLEGMAPLVMGVTGAMDLLNVSTKLLSISNLKNVATTVASRTAMVAGAVATGAVTAAQWALNAAMTANPIGLIIAAIVALVAVFVIAYKKSETFRKIVDAAWKGIKAAAVAVFDFLKGYFVTVFNVYKTIFTAGITAFKRIWEGLKAIGTFVQGVWNSVVGFFRNGVNNAVNVVKGIGGKIKSALSGATSWLLNVGKDIMRGMVNGINAGIQWVKDKIATLANMIPDSLKSILGISSPSRVLAKIGEQTIAGFAKGFESISGKDMVKGLASDLTRTTPSLAGTMSLSGDAISHGRGGGAAVVHNWYITAAPFTDPAEIGRQIQSKLDAYHTTYGR